MSLTMFGLLSDVQLACCKLRSLRLCKTIEPRKHCHDLSLSNLPLDQSSSMTKNTGPSAAAPCTPGLFRKIAPHPAFTPARPIVSSLETPSRINRAETIQDTENENASAREDVTRVVNAVYRIRPIPVTRTKKTQSSEIWEHGTLVELSEWNEKTKKYE